MRLAPVSREELLDCFERLCDAMRVRCRGFRPADINGPDQWALIKRPAGWVIVCGAGGCGVALGPAGVSFPTRRSMYFAMKLAMSAVIRHQHLPG